MEGPALKGPAKGLVFDIQGFSVHDGPGCRTAVFLSGCPLRCSWCSNPEGMTPERRMLFRRGRCSCEARPCVASCPSKAIKLSGTAVEVFRPKCGPCEGFHCVEACPKGAFALAGRWLGTDELMRLLVRDSGYWGIEGGVSFTGGEPLLQFDFLMASLGLCREKGFHAVLETCGQAAPARFLEAAALTDFMFVDLKHMDPAKHRQGAGVGNEQILGNLTALAASSWKGRLVVRVPVVPGFNDSLENLRATALFVKGLGLKEINLLPFHRLGASKYESLGLPFLWESCVPHADETLRGLQREVQSCGVECYQGSDTPF